MEDLIKAAQSLITYIEENNVFDTVDYEGDGQIDYSQSYELKELTNNLQYAIEDAIPARDAMKLIKKCLIESIQTAIQTTRQ